MSASTSAKPVRPTRDAYLLFSSRVVRLLAYGGLTVVLVPYLEAIGLSKSQWGALLTLTLVGDIAISLYLTTTADRLGRRRTLAIGAVLMTLAGLAFVATHNYWLLVLAGTIGVLSPSGNEVGPFLAVEQAALSQLLPEKQRTGVFAWYALFGSLATACGALLGGLFCTWWQQRGGAPAEGVLHATVVTDSYRLVLIAYALAGVALLVTAWRLSPAVEVPADHAPKPGTLFGLHRSRGVVAKLSALFSLDAFGGGFVMQSLLVAWFHARFHDQISDATLGIIFFFANILAGLSALSAASLSRRFGLINTMVFTHLPSNVLLILVPCMPTLPLAIVVLLLRFAISSMDVPARQAYTMAVVDPDERSAAAGITGVARSTGAAVSPALAGLLMAAGGLGLPIIIGGSLKIVYDLLLYRSFQHSAAAMNTGKAEQAK